MSANNKGLEDYRPNLIQHVFRRTREMRTAKEMIAQLETWKTECAERGYAYIRIDTSEAQELIELLRRVI